MGLSSDEPRPSLWSDLPAELAGLILRRLPPSHADRLSFLAVCRQWRLAAQQQRGSLPPALPWLRLGPRTFQSLPGGEVLRLTGWPACTPSKAARTCSFDGWLLLERGDGTCFLGNPFSGATVDVPRRLADDGSAFSVGTLMRKMVVCSPDLVAATLLGVAVGLCRPGDDSWWASGSTFSRPSRDGWYEDIAFHRGKVYALTADEELISLHVADNGDVEVEYEILQQSDSDTDQEAESDSDTDSENTEPEDAEFDPVTDPEEELPSKILYLVASHDKLLMVKWSVPRVGAIAGSSKVIDAIKLKVFVADLEKGKWVELKNGDLGGQALFVSKGCSRTIHLDGHDQGFQGDRVYFLGVDLATCCKEVEIPSYGFYDLRTETIGRIFLNGGRYRFRSEWFFP